MRLISGPVLPDQPQDQFLDFANRPGPSRLACVTRIRLPSDELPGPGQQSLWHDKDRKLVVIFAADPFDFGGQARPLSVSFSGLGVENGRRVNVFIAGTGGANSYQRRRVHGDDDAGAGLPDLAESAAQMA